MHMDCAGLCRLPVITLCSSGVLSPLPIHLSYLSSSLLLFTVCVLKELRHCLQALFLRILFWVAVIIITPYGNRGQPLLLAILVCVSQAVTAPTILLFVKTHVRIDPVLALAHFLGCPIIEPPLNTIILLCSLNTRLIHLVSILPSARGISGGDGTEAMLRRIQRSPLKAHIKTHGASGASLRTELHALRASKPLVCIIIRVHERNTQLVCKAFVLLLPDLIFLFGMDIGVVEEDGDIQALLLHLFNHRSRTRGATGVQ
mmetsp:Transcript_60779/g.100396  ORF Transcript_60779/g.100396 Transcript_60779/m.100396 type:complete len:259 (+) Transcript_60779:138-914(+)